MGLINISDFNNYKITETEIINRIISGEKELFEILLRRNNQKLYRVIRGYISDVQEIEDLMQNTYIKAFEKLYQFQHKSEFSTWLIRIGINEALFRVKEKSKTYSLNNQTSNFDNNRILEIPDMSQLNAENKIIAHEAKQLLEYLIDSLESKYKVVYIMKEVEGMKIKDISDCLSLSVSNVKVRLHRAKNMLKEKFNESTTQNDIFEFGNSRCDRLTERVMAVIL